MEGDVSIWTYEGWAISSIPGLKITQDGQPKQFGASGVVAHVHDQTCAFDPPGGAHWQVDGTEGQNNTGAVLLSNEAWINMAYVEEGEYAQMYHGITYHPYALDTRIDSIVVHDPENGDRLACCDLTKTTTAPTTPDNVVEPSPYATCGDWIAISETFAVSGDAPKVWLAPYGDKTYTIMTADSTVITKADGSSAEEELTAATVAHIHASPCSSDPPPGGPHWQLNETGIVDPYNEAWMVIAQVDPTDGGETQFQSWSLFPGEVDDRIMSFVIHNPADNSRMACCDLDITGAAGPASGPASAPPGPVYEPGADIIEAPAQYECSAWTTEGLESNFVLDGGVKIWVGDDWAVSQMNSLKITENGQAKQFGDFGLVAHVHDEACTFSPPGGPHWQLDAGEPGNVTMENEAWINLAYVGDGEYEGSYHGITLHEYALDDRINSIVVHNPEDNSRMACCDLTFQGAATTTLASELTEIAQCGAWQAIDPSYTASGTPPSIWHVPYETEYKTIMTTDSLVVEASSADAALPDFAAVVAHIHASPCAEEDGGPHWQIEEGGPVDPWNEGWMVGARVQVEEGDVVYQSWSVGNFAVDDRIKSIVLHNPIDNSRMVCCDLEITGDVGTESGSPSTDPTDPNGPAGSPDASIAASIGGITLLSMLAAGFYMVM